MGNKLKDFYLKENMPKKLGMFETNIFYRDNKNTDVKQLMTMWSDELIANSHRD